MSFTVGFIFLFAMFLDARLTLWFTLYLCAVTLTQFLGMKTVPVVICGVGISVGMSILFIPFTLSMVDVVCEVYGRTRAQSFVMAGLFATAFVAGASALAVALPASVSFISYQSEYKEVFSGSLRFSLTSVLSFWCLQVVDVWCFSALKKRYLLKTLAMRVVFASFVALGVDTIIFTLVDHLSFRLSFQRNIGVIFAIFFPYWLLRTSVASLGCVFAYLGVRWLRVSVAELSATSS